MAAVRSSSAGAGPAPELQAADRGKDASAPPRHPFEALNAVDMRVSGRFHARPSSLPLDALLVVPAMATGSYFMPFSLLAFGAVAGPGWMAMAAVSGLATVVCTESMKRTFERQRPLQERIARRRWNLRGLLKNHAFPSGDTAQAASLAAMVAVWSGQPLFLLYAALAAAGRVHFGAHWIGDTIGGAAVGFASAAATSALAARMVAPAAAPPP